jgi:transmembrane sensor
VKFEEYGTEDFIQDASFRKYCFQLDAESHKFWENWILNHPEKQLEIQKAREFLLLVNLKPEFLPKEEYAEELSKIKKAMRQTPTFKILPNWPLLAAIGKIAASIGILLAVSWYVYTYRTEWLSTPQVAENKQAFMEKNAPFGQKTSFSLTDGTTIKLNSGSKIWIAPDYGVADRKVILEGEAFFEVTKDPSKPFSIQAGGVTTTVLGTSFNVNAYASNAHTKVAVLTGSVQVEKNTQEGEKEKLVLQPSEMAILEHHNNHFSKEKYNADQELGWKDGLLYFQETEFKEVIQILNKWYGVTINITNPKLNKSLYTGKFKNQSLENVLTGMSYALDFEFNIQDDQVIIH